MEANKIIKEVSKAVVGKDDQIRKIMLALLSRGHILLEDMPGVGKTTLAKAFAQALGLECNRIQFTPDVLPSDIVGFNAINQQNGEYNLHKGAIFCNLFLADEINRTSSRTQSALLEVMEENQITVDGVTFDAYDPFNVIATQNPYGSAGTQRLPESQMDRFMICLSMGYPDFKSEVEILKRKQEEKKYIVEQVSSIEEMKYMQQEVDRVFVDDSIMDYAVRLVEATRNHEKIQLGASPRGSISLIQMAKANAYLEERRYTVPRDIQEVFYDTMNHRILLKNTKIDNEEVIKKDILDYILHHIDPPFLGK
ncbi:MAG: AAA family ATPase [Traorella sp.]